MRDLINIVENAQGEALSKIKKDAFTAGVALDLVASPTVILIKWISNHAGERGAASKVMRELCSYADASGTRIVLDVLEGDADLIAYYAKFGFKVDPTTKDDAEPRMRREPNS